METKTQWTNSWAHVNGGANSGYFGHQGEGENKETV